MTLTVDLPADAEAFVRKLAQDEDYGSADTVVTAALRALMLEVGDNAYVDQLRAAVDVGLADVAAGRVYPADEVFAEVRERLVERLAGAAAAPE